MRWRNRCAQWGTLIPFYDTLIDSTGFSNPQACNHCQRISHLSFLPQSGKRNGGILIECRAKKKGPDDGDQPGPNNRASRGLNLGDAVLQTTFAELFRSCSRL